MYPYVRTSSVFIVLADIILFNGGCSDEENASLFGPTTTALQNSTITTVIPICSAVAGNKTIVIQGTGFFGTLIDYEPFFSSPIRRGNPSNGEADQNCSAASGER